MKLKDHFLLIGACALLAGIILYEAGVFSVHFPPKLYAQLGQEAMLLEKDGESAVIEPGSEISITFTDRDGQINYKRTVKFITFQNSSVHFDSYGKLNYIHTDAIKKITVHETRLGGKYARNGFLIAGASGAVAGIAALEHPIGAICGLPIGGVGAMVGGIVGAASSKSQTYKIGPNDWEIVGI